jgi:hypothetical protein
MNLKDTFLGVENYFSPRIIGEVNDQYIKVVKIKGQEVPWHNLSNYQFSRTRSKARSRNIFRSQKYVIQFLILP